jgi:L-lactate dehydrogenase complex protein LldE
MGRLAVFAPCFVDQLWPQAAQAAVRLVEALGHEVRLADAVCCGQVFGNSGDEKQAADLSRRWLRAHEGFDRVLLLGASCTGYIRARADRAGIEDFCEWMLREGPARFPRSLPRMVAVHHSCASQRETRSAEALRELLRRVPDLEVQDATRPGECCGFGGSFSAGFPELSVRMGQDKLAELQAAGPVESIVSADCSCLLHLRGVNQDEVRFQHVAELLLEASS